MGRQPKSGLSLGNSRRRKCSSLFSRAQEEEEEEGNPEAALLSINQRLRVVSSLGIKAHFTE